MNIEIVLSLVLTALNLDGLGGATPTAASLYAGLNPAPTTTQTRQQYPVRNEINQSFELSPNAQIDVTGIEGSIKVETTAANHAEIHFVRHARTQRDHDCETIAIQHSANSLTIEHQTDATCHVIQAWEELTLVVPQSANLSFSRIEGDFAAGKTDGYLQLSSIEGSVRVAEVQAAQLEAIEGDVSLGVSRLDAKGITVRGIEGDVELRVAGSVNANLRVRRATDRVDIDLPNAPASRSDRSNSYQSDDEDSGRRNDYSLQVGTGGADIVISGIEGHVKVRSL